MPLVEKMGLNQAVPLAYVFFIGGSRYTNQMGELHKCMYSLVVASSTMCHNNTCEFQVGMGVTRIWPTYEQWNDCEQRRLKSGGTCVY